jgi:site-specific DNA-cytosine methylase
MDVVSLDRDMPADIRCDILDWDFSAYEPKSFDFIWASPPCTEYSIAKTTGVRDIEQANRVSQRTIDIIRYLDPKYWVIENPQTGKLNGQDFMNGLAFNDIDYCKYEMPYRKRTKAVEQHRLLAAETPMQAGLRQHERQQKEAQ